MAQACLGLTDNSRIHLFYLCILVYHKVNEEFFVGQLQERIEELKFVISFGVRKVISASEEATIF